MPQQKIYLERFSSSIRAQQGVTAVEFALAFPILFALIYGILMYSFILLTQMAIQHAAADGARAALRYTPASPDSGEAEARQNAALRAINQQLGWLDSPDIDVNICSSEAESCDASGDSSCDSLGPYAPSACTVHVSIRYPYRQKPVIPSLPGLTWLPPPNMEARAHLLMSSGAHAVL